MVAQLLAHIGTLDAALQNLSDRCSCSRPTPDHRATLHRPRRPSASSVGLDRECGLDMTVFPTVGHFASWAGACPGHDESAGRRRSGRSRPGPSVADFAAHRMRPRGRPQETHLPPRAPRATPRGEQKATARSVTTCSSRTSTSSGSNASTNGPAHPRSVTGDSQDSLTENGKSRPRLPSGLPRMVGHTRDAGSASRGVRDLAGLIGL